LQDSRWYYKSLQDSRWYYKSSQDSRWYYKSLQDWHSHIVMSQESSRNSCNEDKHSVAPGVFRATKAAKNP